MSERRLSIPSTKGYRQFANTIAATYEEMSSRGNFYARMRQYPSARAMYLAENEIPERVYDNLLESVHDALPLLHRYMGFRKNAWTFRSCTCMISTCRSRMSMKTYSYKEAQELILKALKPLGGIFKPLKEWFPGTAGSMSMKMRKAGRNLLELRLRRASVRADEL